MGRRETAHIAATIELTRDELLYAACGGTQRQLDALLRKRGSHFEHVDSWENHAFGAMGELAVAKFTGRYWFPCYDDPLAVPADVGKLQVRTIKRRTGGLWFRHKDNPQQRYVLVYAELPRFTLLGWQWGYKIKDERWVKPADGDKPRAWCLPQSELEPIHEPQ